MARHEASGWQPSVWAPLATRIEIQLWHNDKPILRALSAGADGWWHHSDPLPPGTDYAFLIDGSAPLPDPRSPWQPAGVHANSRVFDTRAHTWCDAGWAGKSAHGAVIYEMHVGTFTPEGTLDAAIGKLDYLADLGIDLVELMPLNAFAGHHGWGYDGVGWYTVHEPYGGPAALQRFVDAAHQRNLGVCLDVVYNHLGPSGNYLAQFGPYFTAAHATPWGEAVNLDDEHAAGVRAFIIDNACRWLREFHIDALRLDAVHALVDSSEQHVLAELATAVSKLAASEGRPLSLIAESDLNDAAMVSPVDAGGHGMQAQWADDVHHAVHAFLTGERHGYYVDFGTPDGLEKVLTDVFLHDGCWSSFRRRSWGAPIPDEMSGHRFVAFASDHDQIGNRALGDRPSARLDNDSLALAAALILTSAYTPMLFMGEEWGAKTPWQFFTDHQEPELVEAIRHGRAAEFGGHGWTALYGDNVVVPDPQAASTLADSRLDWSELEAAPQRALFDWYRTLIALRHDEPALASGDRRGVTIARGPNDAWMIVHRAAVGAGAAISVVFSWCEEPCQVPLEPPVDTTTRPPQLLASWHPAVTGWQQESAELELPGRSVAVLQWR